MNELTVVILSVLQLVFWIVVFCLGFSWVARLIFPNSNWHKKALRKMTRGLLYFFMEPFRKFFRASKWLLVRTFNTTPEYNRNQIFLEEYPVTPLVFLGMLEQVFLTRQVTGANVSRITRREWYLLSPTRIYLMVTFQRSTYFISAVPLGTSFLVTLRFTEMPSKFLLILFQVPLVGVIVERLLTPPTFYAHDLYYAFEQTVRSSVLETTNLLRTQGIRPLTENEQRPLLREFYE